MLNKRIHMDRQSVHVVKLSEYLVPYHLFPGIYDLTLAHFSFLPGCQITIIATKSIAKSKLKDTPEQCAVKQKRSPSRLMMHQLQLIFCQTEVLRPLWRSRNETKTGKIISHHDTYAKLLRGWQSLMRYPVLPLAALGQCRR